MVTFVALLRAVNVGGKSLQMEALRECLGALGLADVRTYVQSGNVVFGAAGTASSIAKTIEEALARDFELAVTVLVRRATDLDRVSEGNPFLAEPGIDARTLHVTFLSQAPTAGAQRCLDVLAAGADRARIVGSEVYVHCPSGYGRTRLSNSSIEKALAVAATTRNWNTVQKLRAMATPPAGARVG